MANNVYIELLNKREVKRIFRALQLTNERDKRKLKALVKAPIKRMEKDSKVNLTKQKSVISGNLLNSFRTTATSGKDTYYAKYESSSKYAYSIDQGTKDRYTSGGKWTGAVGKATTDYKGRNYSFRLGFAERAIKKTLPTIKPYLNKGIERVVASIIRRNSST